MTAKESPAAGPREGHLQAVLLALLVTFLWSSSWVLIKIGLRHSLSPIAFAGLRYSLAFLVLLPLVVFSPERRAALRNLPSRVWGLLVALGLVFYALTQGAQFVGLAYLPAATLSLMLNCTPILVALMAVLYGSERPSPLQWAGIAVSLCGVLVFFFPLSIPEAQMAGLLVAMAGVLANAGSSLLGRHVNSRSGLSPLVVTTVSMGVGGAILLVSGLSGQDLGALEPGQWLIILWLAVVNTALAFTLWNRSLRTLTAVESSLINGLMLPQIALLAWIFLDEALDCRQIAGLLLVGLGVMVVNLNRNLAAVFSGIRAR